MIQQKLFYRFQSLQRENYGKKDKMPKWRRVEGLKISFRILNVIETLNEKIGRFLCVRSWVEKLVENIQVLKLLWLSNKNVYKHVQKSRHESKFDFQPKIRWKNDCKQIMGKLFQLFLTFRPPRKLFLLERAKILCKLITNSKKIM